MSNIIAIAAVCFTFLLIATASAYAGIWYARRQNASNYLAMTEGHRVANEKAQEYADNAVKAAYDKGYFDAQTAHDKQNAILADTAKHYREMVEKVKPLRLYLLNTFPREFAFADTVGWDTFHLALSILRGWRAPSVPDMYQSVVEELPDEDDE